MLVHGREETLALANRCHVEQLADVAGWHLDIWEMADGDVDAAIAIYAAVLAGGSSNSVLELLASSGLDLSKLLNDDEHAKEDITRADLTEFTAAASLVAAPGCDVDLMHMPNNPMMSRRKSDSGFDVAVVALRNDTDSEELLDGEHLTIVTVKHTVDDSAGGLRWKLADSLSDSELSVRYLTGQLRVLNGQLRQEGMSSESAERVYFFLRDFPHDDAVDLFAIGVVAPDLKDDLTHHAGLLPDAGRSERTFRMILMPGLRTVHTRCP